MRNGAGVAGSKVSLFGGFQIEKEAGGPVWLTGKRGPAILAYLARCPGMAAPRERLADLLWSDSDGEHSRNSLRQTLSVLRRDLSRAGMDIVHSHKELIGLAPDAVRVDVRILKPVFQPVPLRNSKRLWRFTPGRFSTGSTWAAMLSMIGRLRNVKGC